MCVHLPVLVERQAERIKQLEAALKEAEDKVIQYKFAVDIVAAGHPNPVEFCKMLPVK